MIDTETFSFKLRQKAIDIPNQRLLLTKLQGSAQEKDLSEPTNCDGVGRIRHFRRFGSEGWPENPLPIDPACHRLGHERQDMVRAEVFQNSACNWRCWYCFVPFELLNASSKHSTWLTADQLVELYCKTPDAPWLIDLSGGQPDLTPEWVPWTMRALQRRGLDSSVYLWSDDNLSNDYFWRFLTQDDIKLIRGYPNYGKVCCFKGFDAKSFSFNTNASPDLFDNQFALLKRYLELGIDLYCYATFTSPDETDVDAHVRRFVDRLQEVSPKLPLRVVPLEVKIFAPVPGRMEAEHQSALQVQWRAIEAWKRELEARFSAEERHQPIYANVL